MIAEQSGHVVPIDQPEVVVDAIRAVVETARGHDVPLCATPAATLNATALGNESARCLQSLSRWEDRLHESRGVLLCGEHWQRADARDTLARGRDRHITPAEDPRA